jgi:hypothetical protein
MMTSAQLRPPHPALPSARLFHAWLERAQPGEMLVYHRGLLAHDRARSDLTETQRRRVAKTADAAFEAAEQGRVHLIQRRHGPFAFSYLAIKALRSKGRLPAPPSAIHMAPTALVPHPEAA